MEIIDKQLAKEEFSKTRDNLVAISTQRMFIYEDLENKILERQSSHLVTISSVAVGIVGVLFPIIFQNKNNFDRTLVISAIILSLCAVYGLVLIIYFNHKENIFNKVRQNSEQIYLPAVLEKTVEMYDKAINGKVEQIDIQNYYEFKNIKKQNYEEAVRNLETYSTSRKKLYCSFLIIFIFGLVIFLYSVIPFRNLSNLFCL